MTPSTISTSSKPVGITLRHPGPGSAILTAWRKEHGPETRRTAVAIAASRAAGTGMPGKGWGKRLYAGADYSRTTADWITTGTTADGELVSSLRPLRNRSRQLCRDNEYAKAAKRIVINNVVGKGIRLQADVKKRRSGLPDTAINDAIESAWAQWSRASRCHTAGRFGWAQMQRAIVNGVFESGEILVRIVRQRFGDSAVPFALELIESDQIVDSWSGRNEANGNEIRMGVEVDQWQRPLAYWMYPRHPGDTMTSASAQGTNFIRVPADDILHIALFDRPYQTRGVPWLHATLVKLRHMGGYEEAEIVAARASANIMGFRQKPEIDLPGPEDGDDSDGIMDGERVTDMTPGLILDLEPGETFTGFSPSRPNAALDPFMRFMLRAVASGVGISYESLSRDYSQSNYSSSRLALLDDRDNWRILQDWLIEHLCQPVFEAWLEMAVLSGAVKLPAYETAPQLYQDVRWAPRGWQWIDPAKESAAARSDIRAGLTTLTDTLAEQGEDIEDVFRRRAAEIALAAQYGLVLDTDPAQVNDKGQTQLSAPTDTATSTAADPATSADSTGADEANPDQDTTA